MRLVLYDKNQHINKVSLNKRICDYCEVEYIHCEPNEVVEVIEQQNNLSSLKVKSIITFGVAESQMKEFLLMLIV